MLEKKLSKNVSACQGLIVRQALGTFAKIPAEHRRWIDLEDVIQEGQIAALEAEKKFRPRSAKFSTFVFNGLTFHYNHEFTGRLRQQKRSAFLFELDSPVRDSIGDEKFWNFELSDRSDFADPTSDAHSVSIFIAMCRALPPDAVIYFVGILLRSCQTWERAIPMSGLRSRKWVKEVAIAAAKHGLERAEFESMLNSPRAIKMALINLQQNSSIGLGTEMDARILECIECHGRFALAAIQTGRYVVDTMTCTDCYRKMQQADSNISCFGKSKVSDHEGYSENDIECTLHCKDKKICRQFVEERNSDMKDSKKTKKVVVAEDDATTAVVEEEIEAPVKKKKISTIADPPKPAKKKVRVIEESDEDEELDEAPAPRKVAKASAKPEKAAKAVAKPVAKAKATKAEDNGEYPAPKEVVRWPHKTGSWMQYCFQRAFQGVKASELEQATVDHGGKWAIFIKVLRGGSSGNKRVTHTWQLDETGGRLKITNVKYLGGKEA